MTTPNTPALSSALAKAQAEFKPVPFDSTNPFLKNRYASLGSVIESSKAILAKHGLAVIQQPTGTAGEIGVTTTLIHESGESVSGTISLPINSEKGKSLAQEAGSIITYLRRYSLAGVLGLYADEDNDGHQDHPTRASVSVAASKPTTSHNVPPAQSKPATTHPGDPSSFERIVDGEAIQDCVLVDYKEVSSKPGAPKPWTAWFCKFETDSGSTFEAGTFDKKISENLDTLKGQVVTIRTQPGRKPGTVELLAIGPADTMPN